MAAADDQAAALRAWLALEAVEAERLTQRLVERGGVEGYGELIYAAFVTAVRRRFSPTWTLPEVIRLVAGARAELLQEGIHVDPRTAEILMRRALGDSVAIELDEEASARAQLFLLAELVVDEQLDDAGLDDFMKQARALAGQLAS